MQRVAILYSKNPKLMYLMQKILYKNAMCVFLTDTYIAYECILQRQFQKKTFMLFMSKSK